MQICDFIDSSERTRNLQELFDLLVRAAGDVGFDQVAYGPAVALNYPAAWQERYFARRYHEFDPVVTHARYIPRPFSWAQLAARFELSTRQRLVLDEAADAGLKNGVSVALHGPWGRVAVVSFASRFADADALPHFNYFNLLASQFHVTFDARAQKLRGTAAETVHLSQREKDCLRWTAQGKSSWDIGVILGISESTVTFHAKNAMRKLGTASRTVAVLRAIRLNLIDLPFDMNDALPCASFGASAAGPGL
jgi:DNA-binding CsgD family transcriptional regulator